MRKPEQFNPTGRQLLRPTRRQLLRATGLTAGAVIASQAVATPAQAHTTRLHDDVAEVLHPGHLYSGTPEAYGRAEATANSAWYRGPGLISAYAGGLYARSITNNTLRTGPGLYRPPWYYPGIGNPGGMRWASHPSFTPEYRFTGRLMVLGIADRPHAHNGLVFHPIHISNWDNYNIVLWRRDGEFLTFGREVNDTSSVIDTWDFPHPKLDTWYEYRIDVLPGSCIRFYWDGELVFEKADPLRSFSSGPVGMRLDYFDVILDETRVYRPGV